MGRHPYNTNLSGRVFIATIAIILVIAVGAGFYLWNVLPSSEDIRWVVQQDAGRVNVLQSIQIIDTQKRPSVTTADLRLRYTFHQQMESIDCQIRLVRDRGDWSITGVLAGGISFASLEELGSEVKKQLAVRDLAERAEAAGDKVRKFDEEHGVSEGMKEGMEKAGEAAKEIWEKIKDDR